jgi:hypothetical protein
MDESRTLFQKWESIINANKDKPNTEIEIRFGRKAQKGFDTNVGVETFQKVLKSLLGRHSPPFLSMGRQLVSLWERRK